MKALMIGLASVMALGFGIRGNAAPVCPEKSWIAEISLEAMTKEDIVQFFFVAHEAQHTRLTVNEHFIVLSETNESGPVQEWPLSTVLVELAKIPGVRIFCNSTITAN